MADDFSVRQGTGYVTGTGVRFRHHNRKQLVLPRRAVIQAVHARAAAQPYVLQTPREDGILDASARQWQRHVHCHLGLD
jgi:hypothetical protein